jgi:hypothetical protein
LLRCELTTIGYGDGESATRYLAAIYALLIIHHRRLLLLLLLLLGVFVEYEFMCKV